MGIITAVYVVCLVAVFGWAGRDAGRADRLQDWLDGAGDDDVLDRVMRIRRANQSGRFDAEQTEIRDVRVKR